MDRPTRDIIETVAGTFPIGGEIAVDGACAEQAGLYACVPACNEERLIGRSLVALDEALDDGDGVVIVANGCRDGTARVAQDAMQGWTRPWVLLQCVWHPGQGSAPLARRLAMDVANALSPHALLLSTDGDTLAAKGLASAHRAAFARGGDLVCGAIDFIAEEAALLPQADPFIAAEVQRHAGGNPLFIEELCHAAADAGEQLVQGQQLRANLVLAGLIQLGDDTDDRGLWRDAAHVFQDPTVTRANLFIRRDGQANDIHIGVGILDYLIEALTQQGARAV